MTGWDTPFDVNLLGCEDVVVNCPRKELYNALTEMLDKSGVRYWSGKKASDPVCGWDLYENDFCFYVNREKRLWHGPTKSTNDPEWSRFQPCTFYGYEDPDIPDDGCCDLDLFSILCGGVLP